MTASNDKTARLWDVPTISSDDSAEDVLLLAEAEASSDVTVRTSEQAEILNVPTLEQVSGNTEENRHQVLNVVFKIDSIGAIPEVERLGAEQSDHLSLLQTQSCRMGGEQDHRGDTRCFEMRDASGSSERPSDRTFWAEPRRSRS